VAEQRGRDEANRLLSQLRLGQEIVVEGRRAETSRQQEGGVVGVLGAGLAQCPAEEFMRACAQLLPSNDAPIIPHAGSKGTAVLWPSRTVRTAKFSKLQLRAASGVAIAASSG